MAWYGKAWCVPVRHGSAFLGVARLPYSITSDVKWPHVFVRAATVKAAYAARTAAIAERFPLDPPLEWFTELPSWFRPNMKLSVVTEGDEAGRVAGSVANWGTYILSGSGDKWRPPRSPSGYEDVHQGDTVTAEGEVIKTANLAADVDHQGRQASWRQARDAAANTGTRLARIRYLDTEYGPVAVGAAWPDLSDIQVRVMQGSGLSGDWRWREEYGEYDLAMVQFVNSNGLPLPSRPIFRPIALAASLSDPHPAVIGSWVCNDEGECHMAPEPSLTLTLTASESARLHELLTAPAQTAAAACGCGGPAHTAAPGGVVTPGTAPDAAPVTREEFDTLMARLDAIEQALVADGLSQVDSMMASLPEVVPVG